MIFTVENSTNQYIQLSQKNVELFVKREDRIHPFVSGNKFRKLKYNLLEAKKEGFNTLLTFGGAYSNHIAAVASAGRLLGYKTIGVIRGEELRDKVSSNATLSFSSSEGMHLKFVTREAYRNKTSEGFEQDLKAEFGSFFVIPEGGTNTLAVKGCEEVLLQQDEMFNYICCAVGTGGTISGIINSTKGKQQVLGFPALKGDFLNTDISKYAKKDNWELIKDYHFGGYAKIDKALVAFINHFKLSYNIPLDPVYTGKMLYGIMDLIEKEYFPKGSKILAIHTGGLQGIQGMNSTLKKKKLPIII